MLLLSNRPLMSWLSSIGADLPLIFRGRSGTSQFVASVYGLRAPSAREYCRGVDGPQLRRVGEL